MIHKYNIDDKVEIQKIMLTLNQINIRKIY